MTPERAAYHYLMLSMGLWEAFDRDFDAAVENEAPLSGLTLRLCAAPPSDRDACRSVLMDYYADFSLDGDTVFRLVLSDVAQRWHSGSLTPRALADLCWDLAEEGDLPDLDFEEFREPYYCWDSANRNRITWERFRECMEVFFQTGCCPFPTM